MANRTELVETNVFTARLFDIAAKRRLLIMVNSITDSSYFTRFYANIKLSFYFIDKGSKSQVSSWKISRTDNSSLDKELLVSL